MSINRKNIDNVKQPSRRRIFVGPVEICGIAEGLAYGLRDLDLDARVFLSTPHPFKYGYQPQAKLSQLWQKLGEARNKSKNFFLKLFFAFTHQCWSWIVFISSLFFFDIFIFLAGQTITNTKIELWALRKLKKKTIMVYFGSEARPPYISGIFALNSKLYKKIHKISLKKKQTIIYHEKYIGYIINSPSTAHYHQKKYINWFAIGIPRIFPEIKNNFLSKRNGFVRILHSPSKQQIKGTSEIIKAIEALKNKGYLIEFVKIEGMSNDTIMREISQCDFVIDQLYSDTPMAVFATEAAWHAKPAIVGGYGFEELKKNVPTEMWPPSKTCHPDNIEQAIEDLIANPEERQRLGSEAQKFVQKKWKNSEVARRYLCLIEGTIPREWWVDWNSTTYIEGCGLPVNRSKEVIRELVEKFGTRSLQLSHRPDLERAFLKFAEIEITR